MVSYPYLQTGVVMVVIRGFFFSLAVSSSLVTQKTKIGLGALKVTSVPTAPIDGQKPGTSGLRKPTKTFMKVQFPPRCLYPRVCPTSSLCGDGDCTPFSRHAKECVIL